jgi:pimeloyl-ACP methyl ester carboxylesterase
VVVVLRSFKVAAAVLRAGIVALVGAVLIAEMAGCQADERRYVSPQRMDTGLIISLDGVGGYNWGPRWLRGGLDEAGCTNAIVIYDWSQGWSGFWVGDLVAQERNHAAARDLAQLIVSYETALPGRPVTIIGHSGGGAVVVWALEALPENCKVERAFLLAPALAPTYDLSKALRAVRSRTYVMYSNADFVLMGAGTWGAGTMDRQHSISAGLVGFKLPPEPVDLEQYTKVRQVGWSTSLMKLGSWGTHMGWTSTQFARDFIAPIIAGRSDPGEPILPAHASGAKAAPPAKG